MPRIKNTFNRLFAVHGLVLILVAALLLEATSLVQYHFMKKGMLEEADRRAQSELAIARLQIEKVTESVEATVQNTSWILSDTLDHPELFHAYIRKMLETNPHLIDAGFAFVTDYFPDKGHWFEPLVARRADGSFEEMTLGSESHDYFQTDWFQKGLQEENGYWSEPYFDERGGRTTLVTFSAPLRDPEGRTVGVVAADISLAWLTEMIVGIQPFPDSFGKITSREGKLMAAPAETLHVAKPLRYESQFKNTGWKMSIVLPEREIYGNAKRIGFLVLLLQLLGLFLLGLIIQRTAHNLLKLKDVSETKEKIENELRIASNIQMAMLPKIFPPYPDRNDIDLFATLVPAKEVGGDLFDYYIRDERLYFCIGDVSGKGVPASLVMAVTRSLFRTVSGHEIYPARIISHMNDSMSEGNESNMFVTFFVGVLDMTTGVLRYCNAGHNAPLLLTDGTVTPLDVKPNLPLGVAGGMRFAQQEMTVPSGSAIFLYTDGLTEAENARHELFGEQRLEKVAGEVSALSAREQVAGIHEAVRQHVKAAPQSDDLTMLCIRYLGRPDQVTDRHLILHNDIQQIPQLADFVETIAEESGLSQPLAMSLNLALEEAVTNVIVYAYPPETDGLVDIEAILHKDRIHFIISDSGQPFDPTQVEVVDINLPLEERPIGGLGIHLVRSIMDEVSYERVGDKNILHLLKRL
jgi:Serine phosphatase RsbU, regulator of sigma subunit